MIETRIISSLRLTELAHRLAGEFLRPGLAAIDATAGNGHDTVFLANRVGPRGRVDGFDIQGEAIAATRARTAHCPQVHLHHLGHEHIAGLVPGPVGVAMFNLGYLPSGDKTLVTRPETTVSALTACLDLLDCPGLLTVMVYPGHEGGRAEADAVESWVRSLDGDALEVLRYLPRSCPGRGKTPYLLTVLRRRQGV